MQLEVILKSMLEQDGSDLHLTVGLPPHARIHGHLIPLNGFPVLDSETLKTMLYSVLTQEQIQLYEHDPNSRYELDFAYGFPNVGRFRFNYHHQRGTIAATVRALSSEVPQMDKLGIPPVIKEVLSVKKGLVLVTGPTGSGKSTTLASMIDYLNSNKNLHIITIEDPIEYLHNSKKSVVTQREVGESGDTMSFRNALKYALRQDPDVILIGEMRDTETIEIALTSAETGHLVFGTLHTSSAPQTISRIIDVFPSDKQPLILTQLGANLEAVFSQVLLPKADGSGRALCMEVMRANSAIRNGIRMNKIDSLKQSVMTGSKEGMISMDQSIAKHVKEGLVTYETALPHLMERTTAEDLKPYANKQAISEPPKPQAPAQPQAQPKSQGSMPAPKGVPLNQNPAPQRPAPAAPNGNGQNAEKRQRMGQTVIPPWEQK